MVWARRAAETCRAAWAMVPSPGSPYGPAERRPTMPARTEKQRKFMGAELARKRAGKKTKTDMSEKKLEEMASKDSKKK
jgi:hypothetical protein